jgi:hypothetical protein
MLQMDASALAAVVRPMLVRIMRHGDVTADIGDKTNSSGMAGFSAVEQAKTDADRIDFESLAFNDDGTPTIDALTRFVQAMPIAEQAALAPDGSPTNQALDRLMAATFNRAYQNDDLVKLYSQSLDPEIKNVLFGMAQAAGDMAALAGKGEYDIRPFVTDAATMASNAKRSGLPLSRIAEQRDMGMADEANDIAALFARNARSAKRIADALRSLARAALAQADADDEDMFGPVAKVPPGDLVREAVGVLDSASDPSGETYPVDDSFLAQVLSGMPMSYLKVPGDDGTREVGRYGYDRSGQHWWYRKDMNGNSIGANVMPKSEIEKMVRELTGTRLLDSSVAFLNEVPPVAAVDGGLQIGKQL